MDTENSLTSHQQSTTSVSQSVSRIKMVKSKETTLRALLPLLSVLERANGNERKTLLSFMSKDATLGLRECIDNCTRNDNDGDEYRHELTEQLSGTNKKRAINYLLKNKADRPNRKNREKLVELSDSLDPVLKSSIVRVERFLQQQQSHREAKKTTTSTTRLPKKKKVVVVANKKKN